MDCVSDLPVETQELAHYAGYKIPQEVGAFRCFVLCFFHVAIGPVS